jgi:hypothetical protein
VRNSTRLIVLASLCAIFLTSAALTWPYTMDDAYISLRYADHLARGWGLSWNPGQDPVEGYSNFLWVLWMALACRLGPEPMVWTKVLGIALGLGVVLLLAREGRETVGEGWPGLLPAVFIATSPMFAFWSGSGIEMPAFTLALLAGYRGLRRTRPYQAASALSAAALLRPEGLALGGVAGALFLLGATGRRNWKGVTTLLRAAALVSVCVLSYEIWRYLYFDSLVANTVQAKWQPFGGVRYFLGEFAYYQGVHLLLAVLALVSLATAWRRAATLPRSAGQTSPASTRLAMLAGAAMVATQAVILANTRPAMGFYLRLFWPVLPYVFLLSAEGIVQLQSHLGGPKDSGLTAHEGRVSALSMKLAIPVVLLALFPLLRDLAPVRLPGALAAAPVRKTALAVQQILTTVHEPLAKWLREEHPGKTVALTDCGLLPYGSGALIIDLWGLNDPEIAREGFDASRVLDRRPDVLVLASRDGEVFEPRFSMDGALQSHPDTARDFRLARKFIWVNRLDGSGDYALWVYERTTLRVRAGRRGREEA